MSLLSKRPPVDIQFSELSYLIPRGSGRNKGYKNIVNGLTGKFLSGQISAILGPSGAGKTTLLNILSGFRTGKVSGEILVGGQPRCLKAFRKQSCYIMQDDRLLQYLTIEEYMQAAALLKLGKNVSEEKQMNIIREILATLNLKENKNTRVSNLSGGEKKRLSIAFELINNPPVMFFDEPTSGLDSQNSFHCISLLKKLAEGGRTIICTIHQPSARLFESFDYLYALTEGHCIYRGEISGLVPFLATFDLHCPSYHNPADFLIEIASGEYGNFVTEMEQATQHFNKEDLKDTDQRIEHINENSEKASGLAPYTDSTVKEPDKKLPNTSACKYEPKEETVLLDKNENGNRYTSEDLQYSVSFVFQFWILLIRTFRSVLRDPMLTLIQFTSHVGVGVFIGTLYYDVGNEASFMQSNVGCLTLILLFLKFTSMMTTVLTFSLEMKVFVREHLNNWYTLKAYYCAKTIVDIPFQVLFTVIFVSIVYFLTNQPYELTRFFFVTLIGILTSLTSQSMGLAIGAAMKAQPAVYFATALMIPIVLFSGMFATYSTIPVYLRWLSHISYIRYAYEGLMLTIYGYGRKPLHCSEPFCMFKYTEKIMDHFEIEERPIWIHIAFLSINLVILRIIGYFIFRWKLKRSR